MKDPPWNPILFICATIATNQSRGARASIGVGVNRRQLWLQLRSWYQLLDITKKAIPAFFLAVVFSSEMVFCLASTGARRQGGLLKVLSVPWAGLLTVLQWLLNYLSVTLLW